MATNSHYVQAHSFSFIFQYLASAFAAKHGDLVADYSKALPKGCPHVLISWTEKKKAEGTLAPFDPSAQYVHPLARVRVKIRISSDQMSQVSHSANGDSIPDSDSEDSTEEDDDFDEDYRAKRRFQPKRATRSHPKDLPFSPRKTRARQVLTIPDSDSNSDEDLDGSPGPRRSTRARKATEILLDSDVDYVDAPSPRRLKLIGPKKSSRRPVIPLYGRVRNIKTLLEDPFDDDDDSAVLRRHRQMCEKCHEGPAHDQLAALKKKPKNRGRKRKRSPEDEFEDTDDEDRLQRQGGWVQWFVSSVSSSNYFKWRSSALSARLSLIGVA